MTRTLHSFLPDTCKKMVQDACFIMHESCQEPYLNPVKSLHEITRNTFNVANPAKKHTKTCTNLAKSLHEKNTRITCQETHSILPTLPRNIPKTCTNLAKSLHEKNTRITCQESCQPCQETYPKHAQILPRACINKLKSIAVVKYMQMNTN